jgi:cobalt-zinc-cadmium resistance protein CzcA
MIGRLLDLVIRRRFAVLAAFAAIAIFGAVSLTRLAIDAVPDITNRQVQINTVAPALGPLEIEKRVTQPVETALAGIPGLQSTRSISRNGFSQVTAVFTDATGIYFARQQVAERLTQARDLLPTGAEPRMGPVTTGLGEVLQWSVDFDRSHPAQDGSPGFQSDGSYLTPEGERLVGPVAQRGYLRTVQDWIIAPQMRSVRGVAGVDSIGGYEKQYVVQPDPTKLAAYGVAITDLVTALQASNISVGADYIHRAGETLLVKADARVRSVPDIENAVVASRNGIAVHVRDLASVEIGGGLRMGAATLDGHEVAIGTVQMLAGANSRTVAHEAGRKLAEIARSLPPGVRADVIYDRSKLVDATIRTVARNLSEGALLVVAVLLLLLGNIRAALIAMAVIPLAMLMTAIGMTRLGVSANLMSLGALDFGLIVDGAVIVVENSLRRLAVRQHHEARLLSLDERLAEVREAAREMIRPTLYGQGIILLVYAPLLTFQGVEGKTFTPMAVTVMLALASALVLSLTLVPALVAVFVTGRVREADLPLIAAAKRWYRPALSFAVRRPGRVVMVGAGVFAVALLLFLSLGREFTPQLDEQDVAVEVVRIPSTSLELGERLQIQAERIILSMPEVLRVYSKIGTAEAATDPMPAGSGDMFVILKPRRAWPDPHLPKAKLVERMEENLRPLLATSFEFTQPIQMRFNELIAGVRSDVAVKIYGEDLDALATAARQVEGALRAVPGSSGVRMEATAGFPTFEVVFDRDAIGRAGLTVESVADAVAVAVGGRSTGVVLQGDRQYDIVVRAADAIRNDPEALGALPIALPDQGAGSGRGAIPLRELASFRFTEGLNQVGRENGKRLVVVQANVRGRDLGGFVADAQKRVAREVKLPPGAWLAWGGQFENLQSAQKRLGLVVPICFAAIFALLWGALGSWKAAGAVFSAVPLALAGGVFALAVRGMPFSITAAVGFIALSGVAVLNGLVMLTSIQSRLSAGDTLDAAICEGAIERLRPVLMTALVASLGFVPMALATGVGAEVQKPLATVVIGGLITATALTLIVLPAIARLVLAPSQHMPAAEPPQLHPG